MTDLLIPYFGYGANESPDMMAAMVGRTLQGTPATLKDFELVVQHSRQASDMVRGILHKNRSPEEVNEFETYAIRPKVGKVTKGMLWLLMPIERELVDNWELNDGLWYQKIDVTVETAAGDVLASTEMMDDASLSPAIEVHPNLPFYINDRDRMLEIATRVREQYLAAK